MTTTDLLPDADEEALRQAVRALLADHCDAPTALSAFAQPRPDFAALRAALLADMGLGELLAGPGGRDPAGAASAAPAEPEPGPALAGAAAHELGRAVAPVPFLTFAVAMAAVRALGADELVERLAGGAVGIVAAPFDSADLAVTTVEASGSASTVSVTGTITAVPDAQAADVLVVPARCGEDFVLVAVEAAAARIEGFPSLDETRPLADVSFDGAAGAVLGTGDAAGEACEAARLLGLALLACECAGLAERVLEIGLDYIRQRRQFGRTLGSFQALKHRAADAWIAVMQLRAAALAAVRSLSAAPAVPAGGEPGAGETEAGDRAADDPAAEHADAAIAVLTAAAYGKKVAVHVAEEMLQFHGGNGMTWEYPIHLYLKRAKADELLLGSREALERELATIIDIEE